MDKSRKTHRAKANETSVNKTVKEVSSLRITKADVDSKPPFSAADQIVTFRIGDNFQEFKIHKEKAILHSHVFERAFNGDFIEGRTQEYTLIDVRPPVFRLVQEWMYNLKLTLAVHDEKKPDTPMETSTHLAKCEEQDGMLVELWILAEKLGIGRLQDAVIDQLIRIQEECGPLSSLWFSTIYLKVAEGSALRRLVVDQTAWVTSAARFERDLAANRIPHEMLRDIALLYSKQAPAVIRNCKVAGMTGADYHVTDDGS